MTYNPEESFVLILSIRDSKAEAYNRPFFSQTRGTAMREVQAGLAQDQTMSSFANDFSIYEIGEFNIITGTITPTEPIHVCNVSDLYTQPAPELQVEDIRSIA